MNMPRGNGRPDEVIKEDAKVFFAGYDTLPPEVAGDPFYMMGLMEMRLALCLVLADGSRKEKREAAEVFHTIDAAFLEGDAIIAMYNDLRKKVGG